MKDKKYKIILYVSLIPYLIVLLISLYHSIFGYHLSNLGKNHYGIDAFLDSINNIWFEILGSPILIILFILLVLYQITYFITNSKLGFKKILLYLSILCWALYILSGIYHMIFGYCEGFFTCTNVYGIKALTSSLFWYGLAFTIIPVLPLTLIYK